MSPKLLLVDDDNNIRTIAQMCLEDDFIVITAASGPEGLECAGQEKPDVILLDMMMPQMDGLTVFGKLKENSETARIPVIFMTAKVQKDEVTEYLNLGALGIITKPFDPMTLSDKVREILGESGSQSGTK